jgi:hypothetical protein
MVMQIDNVRCVNTYNLIFYSCHVFVIFIYLIKNSDLRRNKL